jgi:hypothetical protein
LGFGSLPGQDGVEFPTRRGILAPGQRLTILAIRELDHWPSPRIVNPGLGSEVTQDRYKEVLEGLLADDRR